MDMNDSPKDDFFLRVPLLHSLQKQGPTLLTWFAILFDFRNSCDCIRRRKERERERERERHRERERERENS
jgi:hypothetical protein